MNRKIDDIVEGLKRHLNNAATSFIACVKTDNGDTLDVEDLNGTKYLKVRKIATEKKTGIIITPPAESYVIVSRIAGSNDLFVSMFSEIDKVEYKDTKGVECIIENGKISIKNNSYGIKQAFDELIDAIGKLTVTTATGPSGIPINKAEFDAVKQKISNLLN
jgi:hypothetical protein